MRRSRGRWWWTAVAGAAALALSGCASACPHATTHLDLTLHGGFGYVLNPDFTVEAGFMKSIDKPAWNPTCDVTQLGVYLKVDDGNIVSPAGQAPTIDITNAVVTFGGVGTSAVDMKGSLGQHLQKGTHITGGPGGKKQPAPRVADADWEDLYWVPHTRLGYLDKQIDPQWRTNAVTGRVVLAGGHLAAGIPSDGASVNGIWEFRRNGNAEYQQSITDRLHYTTDIDADQIVITIDDKLTGLKKIVVAPKDNRHFVGLIFAGRHGSQKLIQVGGALEHFCTFYQLLDPNNRPSPNDMSIPYFLGDGAVATVGNTNKQPTPGYYCPGDWP